MYPSKPFKNLSAALPLMLMLLALSACDIAGVAEGDRATLRVRMIDAPFPFELVDSANVTISRVDVHSETVGTVNVLDADTSFNLLDLRNGVSAMLGEVAVEPGTYHEVRLYVDEASIVLSDSTAFDLKVPSDRIKVLLDTLTVSQGEEVELTIDFDVSQSFVVQGDPATAAGIKGFIFKPTVVPAGVERRGSDDAEDGDTEEGNDTDSDSGDSLDGDDERAEEDGDSGEEEDGNAAEQEHDEDDTTQDG